MARDPEHFFMCLLAIYVFYPLKNAPSFPLSFFFKLDSFIVEFLELFVDPE